MRVQGVVFVRKVFGVGGLGPTVWELLLQGCYSCQAGSTSPGQQKRVDNATVGTRTFCNSFQIRHQRTSHYSRAPAATTTAQNDIRAP